jgi:hypothetical protein
MDANHRQWNQGQQKLRQALAASDAQEAIELFLIQHARVHSAKGSRANLWSFEDDVLKDMTEAQIRCVPPGGEHSLAWILFHLTRCEYITMNLLAAGTDQLFLHDDWQEKLKVTISHSGNSMSAAEVAAFSARVDIAQLRAYRRSVALRTREIVKKLKAEQFKQKADPSRVQRIVAEGALLPEAGAILDYWSNCTITGLLLMPPTRHNFLHWNEALRIKQKLQR